MRFYSFGEESFDKLARSKVGDVSAGLLYYLFSGRNAWHSTWITRYTEGCMHGDLQGAKDTAERQRKQGSVFYIAELQALIIKSAAGVLAVTEINSGRPLSGVIAHVPFRLSRWDGERATFEGEAYGVDGADAASSRGFDDGSQVCVEGGAPFASEAVGDFSIDRAGT